MSFTKMYSPEVLANIRSVVCSDDAVTYDSLAEILGTTPTAVKNSLARRGLSLKKIREEGPESDDVEHDHDIDVIPDWIDVLLRHPYLRKQAAKRDMTTKGLVQALMESIIFDDMVKAVLGEVDR